MKSSKKGKKENTVTPSDPALHPDLFRLAHWPSRLPKCTVARPDAAGDPNSRPLGTRSQRQRERTGGRKGATLRVRRGNISSWRVYYDFFLPRSRSLFLSFSLPLLPSHFLSLSFRRWLPFDVIMGLSSGYCVVVCLHEPLLSPLRRFSTSHLVSKASSNTVTTARGTKLLKVQNACMKYSPDIVKTMTVHSALLCLALWPPFHDILCAGY